MIFRTALLVSVLLLASPAHSEPDSELSDASQTRSGQALWPPQSESTAPIDTPGGRIQAGFPVTYRGSVVAGVDTLGRVLIGTDYDGDSLADILFLATAPERLRGPWSWYVPSAEIKYDQGRLRIRSTDSDYALNISHGDRSAIELKKSGYAVVFELTHAIETVVQVTYPFGTGNALSALSYEDTQTWPVNFWDDFLGAGTSAPGAESDPEK